MAKKKSMGDEWSAMMKLGGQCGRSCVVLMA